MLLDAGGFCCVPTCFHMGAFFVGYRSSQLCDSESQERVDMIERTRDHWYSGLGRRDDQP